MKRSTKAERWFDEGMQRLEAGDLQGAFAAFEQAEVLYHDLIKDNQFQYLSNLAAAFGNEGIALRALKYPKEALAHFEKATELLRAMINEGQPQHHPELAFTLIHEGTALYALDRHEEALARFEESAGIYHTLIEAERAQYHLLGLAHALTAWGNALLALNRRKEALTRHEKAAEIFRDLSGKDPRYRLDLASHLGSEGTTFYALKRPREALACFEEAAELLQSLINEAQPLHRLVLAAIRMNGGVALSDLNRPGEALARFEEAAKIFRDTIGEGQPQYRLGLALALVNNGIALYTLNRPGEALARFEEAAELLQVLINEGQPQHRPDLVVTLINTATACADMVDGLETAISHLDRALAVWEGAEAMPAVALDTAPRLATLIHRTRMVAGFAARVERLAQQVARALGGVTPENLEQFYPLAEQAFTVLLNAALDQKVWDLALTVIGTARAQRLAKLAQADLLRRAAREDDPAALREYREAIRRFAELEILLNTGAGPGREGTASGRGSDEDAGQQYQMLYNEYTALRGKLDKLEQTLREQGLLPDLGVGLFDGVGLRQKLPPQAALLLLVQVQEPPANLVVVLTRDGGHAVLMEGGSAWTARLDDITRALKGRGRALRDGPGADARALGASGSASAAPQEPVDAQAEALTETLAEQFWQPIQGVLGDGAKTVWLLPTGDLHGLPWQASAPPDWRCRLAPAPWFVRQALDRAPDPTPLRPTAAAPLGALTYAAPHSDKELLHMPLEERGMRAIWEDAARSLAGLDQKFEPRPAFIALAGHGDSDAAIPGAARIWVGREGAEPRHVGFGELWSASLPHLLSLYLSSCVVGRTLEVNGEPLGLISAGLLRGARYLVGWSVPVDDLGAALFALLYHSIWRDCADPEEALIRARNAFLTGDWPAAAVERARPLLAGHLRDLLVEWIETDDCQTERKELLRKTLSGLHEDADESPGTLESWQKQLDAWWCERDLEAAQAAAEPLAARILDRRARFTFRYIGHFALGFGSTGHPPADG